MWLGPKIMMTECPARPVIRFSHCEINCRTIYWPRTANFGEHSDARYCPKVSEHLPNNCRSFTLGTDHRPKLGHVWPFWTTSGSVWWPAFDMCFPNWANSCSFLAESGQTCPASATHVAPNSAPRAETWHMLAPRWPRCGATWPLSGRFQAHVRHPVGKVWTASEIAGIVGGTFPRRVSNIFFSNTLPQAASPGTPPPQPHSSHQVVDNMCIDAHCVAFSSAVFPDSSCMVAPGRTRQQSRTAAQHSHAV